MVMSGTPAPRPLRLLAVTAAASLALLVTGMPAASAHDELVGSTPTDGTTVDAAPAEVELQFSGAVQELGTQVVVTSDDGRTVSQGPVQIDGATVVQPLSPDLPAGSYTVDWRVTSADGHPESDEFAFRVAGGTTAGAAATSAAPSTTALGEASASSDTGSSSRIWIAAGAVLVLVVAALVAVRQLRRRS